VTRSVRTERHWRLAIPGRSGWSDREVGCFPERRVYIFTPAIQIFLIGLSTNFDMLRPRLNVFFSSQKAIGAAPPFTKIQHPLFENPRRGPLSKAPLATRAERLRSEGQPERQTGRAKRHAERPPTPGYSRTRLASLHLFPPLSPAFTLIPLPVSYKRASLVGVRLSRAYICHWRASLRRVPLTGMPLL
jgi:hypothetical protein